MAFSATASQRDSQIESALREAGALIQAARLEEAEAVTRKLLTSNPQTAEAHALLGLILDQRGLTAEAEKSYDAALRLKPNLVSALSNLGVLLARTNRAPEAIAKFEKVLTLDPHHERAIFNLGALYAARKDFARAVPLLEKAAGVTPGSSELREPVDIALTLTLVNAYVHSNRRK
jgi:Flp pilus assembly protein TadD